VSQARESFEVYLDDALMGPMVRVGTLFAPVRTGLPPSFTYDEAWLGTPSAFPFDPAMQLGRGEQYPPAGTGFGIFLDSAPDRWGRVLMERREALAARKEGRPVRRLGDVDFLLGVADATRIGALRFRRGGTEGPFLSDERNAAPPATNLSELAGLARRIEEKGADALPEYERWIAMLIAPGTSLGGARPKANFVEADGTLRFAKFPARLDRHDVGGWEGLVHELARLAGIDVPPAEIRRIDSEEHTFCVTRFDRDGGRRRMYASAMTLLARRDGDEGASYVDLAEFVRSYGSRGRIERDLEQLFRRLVFNVLVGNRDDHLRNHGFLFQDAGWHLAPAFDMNPSPDKSVHALALDEVSPVPGVSPILATAGYYGLDSAHAASIAGEVREVVARWPEIARRLELRRSEIQLMETVIRPELA
jgi:serine/threonine-protein kinase HipA